MRQRASSNQFKPIVDCSAERITGRKLSVNLPHFGGLEICNSVAKILYAKCLLAHDLPRELIVSVAFSLLPSAAIYGHDDSDTVKRHLFHLLPVMSHVQAIGRSPAIIDKLFSF